MKANDVVYLLHGVDTDLLGDEPEWYTNVREGLYPFCESVGVRYTTYDQLGKLRVASYRGAAFAGILLAAALLLWAGMRHDTVIAAAVALSIAGFALSWRERSRRIEATRSVARQLANISPGHQNHVIAHSFGTYLLPRALQELVVSFDHLILVGSVLQRKFDWDALWNAARHPMRRFQRIRNEYSAADSVARLAGVGALFTGCGGAGWKGLLKPRLNSALEIHDAPNPFSPCEQAGPCGTAGLMHNVNIVSISHSGMFLGENHARLLWLPLFWRSTPLEAAMFRDACQTIAELLSGGHRSWTADGCVKLLDTTWSWFGPRERPATLRSYLESRVNAAGLDAPLEDIARETALSFIAGWQARDREARRCIHPTEAVQAAIEAMLDLR